MLILYQYYSIFILDFLCFYLFFIKFYDTQELKHNHFASFPEELVERCIKAGCPKNGVVLDIFWGTVTTLLVAEKLGRNGIGFELNEEYIEIAKERLNNINEVKPKRKVKEKGNTQSLKTIQHKLFE